MKHTDSLILVIHFLYTCCYWDPSFPNTEYHFIYSLTKPTVSSI